MVEADGMNLEVDSKDEVMHYLNERSVIFKEEMDTPRFFKY